MGSKDRRAGCTEGSRPGRESARNSVPARATPHLAAGANAKVGVALVQVLHQFRTRLVEINDPDQTYLGGTETPTRAVAKARCRSAPTGNAFPEVFRIHTGHPCRLPRKGIAAFTPFTPAPLVGSIGTRSYWRLRLQIAYGPALGPS